MPTTVYASECAARESARARERERVRAPSSAERFSALTQRASGTHANLFALRNSLS